MSSFVTLAQVKSILGISDSSDDTRLEAILGSVLDNVISQIGNIEQTTKKERILKKMTRYLNNDLLPLTYINPTQILLIDGIDFSTKVKGSDYLINENGVAEIPDLLSYITSEFTSFEIEYTAGYATAPLDFVNIIATIVGIEYSRDLGRDVVEETTGPRTVKWADLSRSQGGPNQALKAQYKKLRKYIPTHLKVF